MFWRKLKRGKPHSVIIKCDHYLPVGNSFQVFQLLTLKAGEQSHILRPNKSLPSETRNIFNCDVSLCLPLCLYISACAHPPQPHFYQHPALPHPRPLVFFPPQRPIISSCAPVLMGRGSNHCITQVGRDLCKSSSPNSCSKQVQIWDKLLYFFVVVGI